MLIDLFHLPSDVAFAIQTINYPSGKNEQLEEFCKQNPIAKQRIWCDWRKDILMCFHCLVEYFATYLWEHLDKALIRHIKPHQNVPHDSLPHQMIHVIAKKNCAKPILSDSLDTFSLTFLSTFVEGDDSISLKIDFILFALNHVETKDISHALVFVL